MYVRKFNRHISAAKPKVKGTEAQTENLLGVLRVLPCKIQSFIYESFIS